MFGILKLAVGAGVLWHAVRPGVWQVEMQMSSTMPLSAVRVIAVRLDPAKLRFTLDTATENYRSRGAWSVDALPAKGVVALNGGQFASGTPWGWLVIDGNEVQPPGTGTLGMAFVVDSSGGASLLAPAELPARRGRVRLAFQSYPALLMGNGEMPWELEARGRGVDLEHRDSRLALGITADGSIIVAITRFSGLGKAGERLPFGPTVVEMAAFMKSLGCTKAVLLDGGMSSQLAVRRLDGSLQQWSNFRSVPLGLVISPRHQSVSSGTSLRSRTTPRSP
jgi:exopolysaccharide biosynthesis protein